jgi:thymidylate synthase
MYQQEQGYLDLLQDVLDNGSKKQIFGHDDKYILSVFGRLIRFDLSKGFPLLTTKRVAWKSAFKEMFWFIEGSNDAAKLRRSGCTVWDEWGCKHYNKANKFNLSLEDYQGFVDSGELESCVIPLHYGNGSQWHYGNGQTLDQTKWVIDGIKKTPDRKSFLVNYWDPETVYQMADQTGNESVILPACHTQYSINIQDGKINLSVTFRSWDLFLGAPFNIAQYAMLLHLYSVCTNYPVGDLVIFAADAHIYSDHIDQVAEQISRPIKSPPNLEILFKGDKKYLQDFTFDQLQVIEYNPHKALKGEITVVGGY